MFHLQPNRNFRNFLINGKRPSALEIIPRNSPSLLNVVASDIHNFAIAHNMRLNPTKCKEVHINFLRNSNCLINPIIIDGNVIKSVNTYKILGVIMDKDLKWNSHVDYIIKKACKKLYSLRVLRRARVCQPNMSRIYLGSVRPNRRNSYSSAIST